MSELNNIPEASLVGYIKSKYPKIVFTPIKFNDNSIKTRSLGFVVSDDKLILGYIDKNGELCKLMEPIDLSELSNEKFIEIIKRIPTVNGFSEYNKTSLTNLLENKKMSSKNENEQVLNELKSSLLNEENKFNVLVDLSENTKKENTSKVILIKSEYENKIEEIKTEYEKNLGDLREHVLELEKTKGECKERILHEKDIIIDGIKRFKEQVNEYIKELVNKNQIKNGESGKLNELYTKLLNEKHEIESNMNILIEKEKEYLKQINDDKSNISEFSDKVGEKEIEINKLSETIKEIKKELDEAKDAFSKEQLEKTILENFKNTCLEKILNEKQEIINKIKDYNNEWLKWANQNKVDIDTQKETLKTELVTVFANLKKVFTEKNNYVNSLQLSLKEKDQMISKLNSNAHEIKTEIEKSMNEQLLQLSAKNEELKHALGEANDKLSKSENIVKSKDFDIKKLQKELEQVKDLLDKNNATKLNKVVDIDNCISTYQKFKSVSNTFYRKKEVITILDKIISGEQISAFTNLNQKIKDNIVKRFDLIKTEINAMIDHLDLKKYISDKNLGLLKNKSTGQNVQKNFCDELNNISMYWDENISIFREQDRQLTNIYEDLSGAVRVYIKIKPLIGINENQQQNTVYIEGNVKRVVVDCKGIQGVDREQSFGEFYGVFDDKFSNKDVYTGNQGTSEPLNKMIDINSITDSSDTVHPGLYNTFAQVEDGYSIVIFGYGLSGSGKTYSLLGQDSNPGLLHFGLANLNGVQNIKMKYLFEQYIGHGITGFNPAFQKITGKVINLVNRVPFDKQVKKEVSIDETSDFSDNIPIGVNMDNLKVDDINKITYYLEKYRTERGRVKRTPNNPVSSRSHLYMVFEITFSTGKVGYITIVDTAGRESPIEIYNLFINNSSKNASLTSIFSPTGKGLVSQYLRKEYKDDNYDGDVVFDILREGFYINETINHLIYFFNKKNYKNTKIAFNKNLDSYTNDKYWVSPIKEEKQIDPINDCLMIPILNFLDILSNKKGEDEDYKPTKYVTLVCVRKDVKYCSQIFGTLEFAEKIRSS